MAGSLRGRLVVGMLVLLIAAVVTTDVVTYSSLRSFLFGRLDEQIVVTQGKAFTYIREAYQRDLRRGVVRASADQQQAWLAQLDGSPDFATCIGSVRSDGDASPPDTAAGAASIRSSLVAAHLAALSNPDVYVEVLDADGSTVFADPSGSCPPDPAPRLPRALPVQVGPVEQRLGAGRGPFVPLRTSFDVASAPPGVRYRAQAVAVPGGLLVTAIALNPTSSTLASVVHIELIVSVGVLVGVVLLGLLVVRFGLRPLDDMTDTARAIAAGDLARRVRPAEPGTEVGRLGAALNGMLSQIEAAFSERTASESRLRRFVADASHELRTPLTSIRGYAELLRKDALTDEAGRRRAAQRIEGEAARMGVLVDDLLLLARLDQGRPLEHEPVDLGHLAVEAAEDARTAHPRRPITVDLVGPVVVDGDSGRLRQVVDNLLGNALVHTPEGTPVTLRVATDGDRAVLTVADQGPGLVPEQARLVFDRFYRGRSAPAGTGSGLGLSIVDALARAHGGSASVASTPGEGARFTVVLPIRGNATPRPGAERAVSAEPDRSRPAGSR